MRNLHRNRRKLYVAEVYWDENGRKKYKRPIELYENWQVVNSDSLFMNIGWEVYDYIKIKTTPEHAKYYHMGDKVYINTVPSDTFDTMSDDADYIVKSDPIVTLSECSIMLHKMSGENGGRNIF